jgi:DNA-binding NarL/FixJ family response regulator
MLATTTQRRPEPAASTMTSIGVLVVDDHPAVRHGVQALVDSQPAMRVVTEARSAEEALTRLTDSIDVAVIDYHLGDGRDGLSLTADLKALEDGPRVLVYSAFADLGLAVAALIAGADGLVGKHELGQEVCRAIRTVAGGQNRLPAIPASVVQAMRARLQPPDQAIFGMLVDGIDSNVIAECLGITRRELHRRRLMMLRSLTTGTTPMPVSPTDASAPLDYERARRRPSRRAA